MIIGRVTSDSDQCHWEKKINWIRKIKKENKKQTLMSTKNPFNSILQVYSFEHGNYIVLKVII